MESRFGTYKYGNHSLLENPAIKEEELISEVVREQTHQSTAKTVQTSDNRSSLKSFGLKFRTLEVKKPTFEMEEVGDMN